jgi:hypothetical protein
MHRFARIALVVLTLAAGHADVSAALRPTARAA